MKGKFAICNKTDKEYEYLEIIDTIDTMEVECICGDKVKFEGNMGKCFKCGNLYMGPLLLL